MSQVKFISISKLLCFSIPSLITIVFVGCSGINKKEIEQKIKIIYDTNSPYNNATLNENVFSKELYHLIDSSKKTTDMDSDRILKSEYPTDKPICIEGEIFASVYEGFSSYSIKDIKGDNKQVKATINFVNDYYNLNWHDTLLLINENGWKLDNVLYDSINHGGNLKTGLIDMVNSFQP